MLCGKLNNDFIWLNTVEKYDWMKIADTVLIHCNCSEIYKKLASQNSGIQTFCTHCKYGASYDTHSGVSPYYYVLYSYALIGFLNLRTFLQILKPVYY